MGEVREGPARAGVSGVEGQACPWLERGLPDRYVQGFRRGSKGRDRGGL